MTATPRSWTALLLLVHPLACVPPANERPDLPDPAPHAAPSSIRLVDPPAVGLGRELELRIAIDGAVVGPDATVDLGAGIEAQEIVAQDDALVVKIAVASDAGVGPRDVTVSLPGAPPLVAEGCLWVEPSLDVEILGGDAIPGGVVEARISTRDGERFDPQVLHVRPVHPESPGFLAALTTPTETDSSVLFFLDPTAAPGPMALVASEESGEFAAPFYSAPDAIVVEPAHNPLPDLPPATRALDAFTARAKTYRYTVTPPEGTEGTMTVIGALERGSTFKIRLLVYPSSGNSAGLLDAAPQGNAWYGHASFSGFTSTRATTGYVTVYQQSYGANPNDQFTLGYRVLPALRYSEPDDHVVGTSLNFGTLPAPTDPIPGTIISGKCESRQYDQYDFHADKEVLLTLKGDSSCQAIVKWSDDHSAEIFSRGPTSVVPFVSAVDFHVNVHCNAGSQYELGILSFDSDEIASWLYFDGY